jgi:hypothetical protein
MGGTALAHVILRHTLAKPRGLLPCSSVLDVGSGIRPCAWYEGAARHVCVEPFGPYCRVLRENGHEVMYMTAIEAFWRIDRGAFEAVLMLDVLEHMERNVGERAIEFAVRAASRQVVIYTPMGFLKQEHDAWGMGGGEWQKHRSGWTPEDFPGWDVQIDGRSFFALRNV